MMVAFICLCLDPVVELKTNGIIGNTLFFASFERMDQPQKDFIFKEVKSHHEIRHPCLTYRGFAVIQHGDFCNNGVELLDLFLVLIEVAQKEEEATSF